MCAQTQINSKLSLGYFPVKDIDSLRVWQGSINYSYYRSDLNLSLGKDWFIGVGLMYWNIQHSEIFKAKYKVTYLDPNMRILYSFHPYKKWFGEIGTEIAYTKYREDSTGSFIKTERRRLGLGTTFSIDRNLAKNFYLSYNFFLMAVFHRINGNFLDPYPGHTLGLKVRFDGEK